MPDHPSALLTIPETLPACDFDDAARLEFQAALQLLAERACFLTAAESCAIALDEGGILRYCATLGNSHREPGTDAPLDAPGIRECFSSLRPAVTIEAAEPVFVLFVPILRDNKAVGFFELASGYQFDEPTKQELVRLGGLAAIAQDLRDAAVNAPARILQASQSVPPPRPVLWHAPDKVHSDQSSAAHPDPASSRASEVRTCTSCGFPVSPGRSLCVECERNREADVTTSTQMFTSEKQESWLSRHGYTIASLLVTAVTLALILWLRR